MSAARKAGALALVLVNLALAAESALYLAVLPELGRGVEAVAALVVRSVALTAVATISSLIYRRESAKRRRP